MRNVNIIIIFIICLGLGLFFRTIFKQPVPKLKIENKIVDLGKVGVGQRCPCVFAIENQGSLPLTVELKKVSCACTVAKPCKSPLAPKERATMTVYINAPKGEGAFGARIYLETSDPKQPLVTLGMQGVAETVMLVNPEVLLFGDISSDQLPKTKKFTLKPGKLAPPNMLDVLEVGCTNEYFKVETNKTAEEVTIFVTLCKEAPIGALRSSITLCVEELNNYKINIPTIAHVTGNYKISPNLLFYGKVTPGVATIRECRVKLLNNGDTVELVDNDSFDKGLLSISVKHCEGEAIVKVVLLAKSKHGTFEGTLKLKLTPKSGQQEYLQIPIVYIVDDPENQKNNFGVHGKTNSWNTRIKEEEPAYTMIGSQAPDFTLDKLDGGRVTLSQVKKGNNPRLLGGLVRKPHYRATRD